jgi:ABC-type transport system involved in multi-copper enzyme maturation permease subunit
MTMVLALLGRSLARVRGALVGVAALLCVFQAALVLQAASYDQQQTFESLGRLMPAFVQRWFGDSLAALASFSGVVAFGYFHPVVVLLVAMIAAYAASDPAADVEEGYVDLLLSRPTPRHWLVSRSAILALACPLALAVLMIASTLTTVAVVAPASARGPSPGTIITLAAHLVAVAWCFGALSLAIAGGARRRSTAFATTAIVAVALYFINVLAASWKPARAADFLSPFHYYRGAEIVAGITDPARDLLLLGSAAVLLIGASYWRFRTRDL